MNHLKIESELLDILGEIKSENKTIIEWRECESSDMFQCGKYCGGFDSIEDKFTFSYYPNKGEEFWFDLSLEEIDKVLDDEIKELRLRKSE